MNDTSTAHHTIVVKRTYAGTPQQVFAAWTDPKALVKWYVPGDATWTSRIDKHDLRVGGVKQITFGPRGQVPFTEDCRYEDIVPERRLCFSMTIAQGAKRITTSMVTVQLSGVGARTEVVVTDQLVILDGGDTSGDRERGWGETLDKLPAVL
ncbi:MAG TPA: SRPBCC domain-containing protein [Pseudomonadales bacterium]